MTAFDSWDPRAAALISTLSTRPVAGDGDATGIDVQLRSDLRSAQPGKYRRDMTKAKQPLSCCRSPFTFGHKRPVGWKGLFT